MTQPTKCSNCGAQVPPIRKGSLEVCPYCGTALADTPSTKPDGEETNELGYTPDPPSAYPEHLEGEVVDKKEPVETIIVDGKPVDIPPEVVSTVIQTGRNISRYAFIAIAVILALCSACYMLGIIRK
jgi:hypothetical protein